MGEQDQIDSYRLSDALSIATGESQYPSAMAPYSVLKKSPVIMTVC